LELLAFPEEPEELDDEPDEELEEDPDEPFDSPPPVDPDWDFDSAAAFCL